MNHDADRDRLLFCFAFTQALQHTYELQHDTEEAAECYSPSADVDSEERQAAEQCSSSEETRFRLRSTLTQLKSQQRCDALQRQHLLATIQVPFSCDFRMITRTGIIHVRTGAQRCHLLIDLCTFAGMLYCNGG